jgi:hypothetical protein
MHYEAQELLQYLGSAAVGLALLHAIAHTCM